MVFERLATLVKSLRLVKVALPPKPAALEEWEKKSPAEVPKASPIAPQTASAIAPVSSAVPTVRLAEAIAPVAKTPSIPAAPAPEAFRAFGAI